MSVFMKSYIESLVFKPPLRRDVHTREPHLYVYPVDIAESKENADLLTTLCLEIYNASGVPCICANPSNGLQPKFWIVYAHGNIENLENVGWFLRELANVFQCSVFAFEYPGYYSKVDIASDKQIKPTEASTFLAAERFTGAIRDRAPVPTVLLGYSLGTAPTLHAAEVHRKAVNGLQEFPAAVILLAPFVSAASVVLAHNQWSLNLTPLWQPFDIFCLRHSALVQGHPLLVVVGGQDDVVPPTHGERIYQIAGKHGKSSFFVVPEANHASLRIYENVWKEVARFLEMVLRIPVSLHAAVSKTD